MNYVISDYLTLAPNGVGNEYAETCRTFDVDPRNRKFVVHYDDAWRPAGGIEFDSWKQDEIMRYRRLAKARTAYATCRSFPHWPSQSEVSGLVFGKLIEP